MFRESWVRTKTELNLNSLLRRIVSVFHPTIRYQSGVTIFASNIRNCLLHTRNLTHNSRRSIKWYVDEIFCHYHSNETSSAVLSHDVKLSCCLLTPYYRINISLEDVMMDTCNGDWAWNPYSLKQNIYMVPFVFIFDKTNVEFRESVLDSATTLS